MTLAIVNVLPEPVTPSSTWLRSPRLSPSTSSGIARAWSPFSSKSETSLNLSYKEGIVRRAISGTGGKFASR